MTASSNVVLLFPLRNRQSIVKRNVLSRLKNTAYRSREYLTEQEVAHLMEAAGRVGRHGQRDATLIMLAYRHGLRVSELVNLCWE
jgi:type 1 fimbriae regulatory protein FimB/type 1 fimbriae regulatory protein FimE